GDDTSKTAFLKAVENLQKLDFSSKAALTGLKQLIQEFDLLNKKTEQFYSTRNIKAVPVEQLGGAYSGILEKLGRARAELSKTLGLIKSEFQYVPRMAESVRNQIISLAKAGYDLSATEVRNIKQVVQYRDIELQTLQVKANLLRAGLVSDREAISLIQQASNYAQKYNLSLKEVLNTLNLSTKDWASFYASSIKSKSGLTQIRSELDIINNLISAGISGNKAITTEIMANLRARQKELQIEEQIINIENQRISTLANMVRYYELMAEKSRLALSSRMQEDLKGALRVLAEINTQLEGQYNIESNLSKLRQLITSSYAKDFNASKLIEASGLKREQIEQAIATAREQSIRSLQLQYQLGLLNEQGQKELKDLLLQQTNLTAEQQVLLGKINTQLTTEKSAYSLLISEQEKLNTLLASQVEYIRKLRTTGGSKEDIRDAERVLALTKERKQIVDETLRAVRRLGDVSDKLVRDTEKEVTARIESKKVLDSINASKIRSLTTGIRELKTVAELRAREKQILDILKAVSKYLAANGRLTSKWKDNTLILEKSLGRVRQALKKAETEAGLTQGSIGGAASALSGFFNFRLVGVFMLYRALWELRRAFSDVAKAAIELEDKLKKFQAITLATTEDIDIASTTVLNLSKQYALAATDIADALIKIGQAGYTAQESIALITSTSQLTVATGSELSDTVNLMLSTMQAWNLETSNAADVANIFTSAINSTRLTVDRLNTSFNYITGIAPQLNVTLEETAAILGTMADAGIRASTSGTSMRAMFAELLKPSNRLIDTLRSLGLTIDEVDPQLHTITEILLTLKNAGFSAADSFRAFGRRAASGIAVLVSNAEKVAELSTSFNNYARAASLAAIASESLQARLSVTWNKIRALAADTIEPITHLIDAFSGLRHIDIGFDGGFHVFSKTLGEVVLAA
ncbi:MAG: phage tail tape measure protein, partial [Thermoprotei archaeon]